MDSTFRAFGSPCRYIQGPGALDRLPDYARALGGKAAILVDSFLYDSMCSRLERSMAKGAVEYSTIRSGGECSEKEISRVCKLVSEAGARIIAGIGGGKTLDVAKYVAKKLMLYSVIIPSSASCDAATSAMSVLYHEDGSYDRCVRHGNNPDLILVDSEIILNAPVRLFAAGIGDALSTYYEATACETSGAGNYIDSGFSRCRAGIAIAKECFDILKRDAVTAMEDVRSGRLSKSVEDVIEANILLSGLGFENTGCAAAHSLHTGLHVFPQANKYLHGEMVAFGVLFQAVLEDRSREELDWLVNFLAACELPVTLAQFGIDSGEDTMRQIVNAVLSCDSGIEAEPFPVTEQIFFEALARADALGREFLESRTPGRSDL